MKWPEEELRTIEAIVAERIEAPLGVLRPGEGVRCEGETREDETWASLSLSGLSGGARLTFEVRLDRRQNDRRQGELDEEAAQCLVLDALDSLVFEWIESGGTARLHGGWQARRFQGRELAVRAERRFPELEAQADAILAEAGESTDA